MNSVVPIPLQAPQVHSSRWVADLREAHRGQLWKWLSIAWAEHGRAVPPYVLLQPSIARQKGYLQKWKQKQNTTNQHFDTEHPKS